MTAQLHYVLSFSLMIVLGCGQRSQLSIPTNFESANLESESEDIHTYST